MFFSNANSPLLTTTGTYHDAVIAIKNVIVGATNSPWAEVTNAAPTPAFLRPFASTAVAASQAFGYDKHITLYLKNDPGLLVAEPHARMFRMIVGGYGLHTSFIDTKFADASLIPSWCFCGQDADDLDSYYYYYQQSYYQGTLFGINSPEKTNIGVGRNIKTTILMWDDTLYIKSIRSSDGVELGGVLLFYPNTVPGDQQTTETLPLIFAMPVSYSYDQDVWRGLSNARSIFNARKSDLITQSYNSQSVQGTKFEGIVFELGFIPSFGDKDDREYMQRIGLVSNMTGTTHWLGLNPNIRISRSALAQGLFDRKTIDGVDYLEIRNIAGQLWFLRLADNSIL